MDAFNKVIDKLEAGKAPTLAELKAAGFCPACTGHGQLYRTDADGDDYEVKCLACDGTGLKE